MAKKPVKSSFDKTDFVFDTPVADILRGMNNLYRKSQTEKLTDLELYWLGWWEMYMPVVESSLLKTVKTCAQENAVLGIYNKRKRATKQSKRKTKLS
ncbi:hypothetical protein BAU67_001806 [Escherichia coli]|nr:hypothetical protein [Escherichia coli]EMB7054250.1 hypothetical protein [Escherichia coli]